MTDEEKLLL